MRIVLTLVFALAAVVSAAAQDVSLEYRVKAAYLFNFVSFVEWPPAALDAGRPLTICIAEENPFGPALAATLGGQTAGRRMLLSRVVRGDTASCHILFIPRGVSAAPHLRRVGAAPILTVGESGNFIEQGGMVNFILADGRVRFEINPQAAARHQLKISSRLLQLARVVGPSEER